MGKWARVGGAAAVLAVAAALAVFLVSQGLDKAGLWATALGLPLGVIIAIAAVWTAMLAAKPRRGPEHRHDTQQSADLRSGFAPGVTSSGGIRQDHTSGTAVAHTGRGDINIAGPPAGESPDECG
jgi:hypothetical protein